MSKSSHYFERARSPLDGRPCPVATSAAVASLRGEPEPPEGFDLRDADQFVEAACFAAVSQERIRELMDDYTDRDGPDWRPIVDAEVEVAKSAAIARGVAAGLTVREDRFFHGFQANELPDGDF